MGAELIHTSLLADAVLRFQPGSVGVFTSLIAAHHAAQFSQLCPFAVSLAQCSIATLCHLGRFLQLDGPATTVDARVCVWFRDYAHLAGLFCVGGSLCDDHLDGQVRN